MAFSVIDTQGRLKIVGDVDTTGTPANDQIAVFTDVNTLEGSSAFTYDGTTLAIPGQIKFPATQVASANANTLDDYEEGSWTPTIGGSGGQSGQAYTTQTGLYVKIGSQVTVWFVVTLSTLGTITGNVQVKGLPFTVNASVGAINLIEYVALTTTWVSVIGQTSTSTTVVDIRGATAAATTNATALVQADLSNTTLLVGAISYQV
jgi:hypothetical protein